VHRRLGVKEGKGEAPWHYYLGNDSFVLWSSDMQQSTGMKIAQNGQSGEIWITGPSPEGTHTTVISNDLVLIRNQMGQSISVPYSRPDGSQGTLVYTMGVLTGLR
jgi:hypothetical protein